MGDDHYELDRDGDRVACEPYGSRGCPVLAGAALAGLPGLAGVLLGVHWLGPPVGVVLFGLWCGRGAGAPSNARQRREAATVSTS